ncbi:uncharacterized protein DUF1707 [Stackebrandtia albiflava]|uniref:Uncharacterized protein DUF1707 n=1 Tax=Stackebrandtia albiflava TaxID=406432 RepID=A0A562V3A1_9ACTN|nr:DUF1707 domain-containing protein [Stackebrandtia albiflava]TWJ12379.1 uncharacterized protein DUF1707 [Stackebrandtia albiflava]
MSDEPLPPGARAGDTDRKRTADRLKQALDEGRLDLAEYDERVQAAYLSKTYGELDALLADIPGVAPVSKSALQPVDPDEGLPAEVARRRRRRRDLKNTWTPFGGAAIFFTGIWAIGWMTSGEMPYYWPVWVLGIWGLIALCTTWSTLMKD